MVPLNELSSYVPLEKNYAPSNYLKDTLVLLLINYVGVLLIILLTPWPCATDPQGVPGPHFEDHCSRALLKTEIKYTDR